MVPFGLGVPLFFHCKYSILFHEQPDGRLQQARLPRSIKQRNKFIDMLQEHSCYVQQNVKVNLSWTHEDVTNKLLRVCFPKAFQYFDSRQSTSSLPNWQLLSQNGGRFELCQVAQPSGANLHRNKGREKAGIADSSLWFGRSHIVIYNVLILVDSWKQLLGTPSQMMYLNHGRFIQTS